MKTKIKNKKKKKAKPPTCVFCDSEKDVVIHHIDGDKKNNNITNLIAICRKLHGIIHTHKTRRIFLPLLPKKSMKYQIGEPQDYTREERYKARKEKEEWQKKIKKAVKNNFYVTQEELAGFFKITAIKKHLEVLEAEPDINENYVDCHICGKKLSTVVKTNYEDIYCTSCGKPVCRKCSERIKLDKFCDHDYCKTCISGQSSSHRIVNWENKIVNWEQNNEE